jgi:hypothetical protein
VSGRPASARVMRARAQERLEDMLQSQLEIARVQAEGWRNFLASATGLLAAVLVLKGRENVAELPSAYRLAVVAAVSAGLVGLLGSAFVAASAAHGRPGEELIAANGASLLRWELLEVRRVGRYVAVARWLAVAGVLAIGAGVMLTWVAPASGGAGGTVSVQTRGGAVCGSLVESDRGGVTVRVASPSGGEDTLRRLAWGTEALSAAPVDAC